MLQNCAINAVASLSLQFKISKPRTFTVDMPSAAPFFVCMDVCLVFELQCTFDLWPAKTTGYSRLIYGQISRIGDLTPFSELVPADCTVLNSPCPNRKGGGLVTILKGLFSWALSVCFSGCVCQFWSSASPSRLEWSCFIRGDLPSSSLSKGLHTAIYCIHRQYCQSTTTFY